MAGCLITGRDDSTRHVQGSQAAGIKGLKDLMTLVRVLLPPLAYDLGQNDSWSLCHAGLRNTSQDISTLVCGCLGTVNTLPLFLCSSSCVMCLGYYREVEKFVQDHKIGKWQSQDQDQRRSKSKAHILPFADVPISHLHGVSYFSMCFYSLALPSDWVRKIRNI